MMHSGLSLLEWMGQHMPDERAKFVSLPADEAIDYMNELSGLCISAMEIVFGQGYGFWLQALKNKHAAQVIEWESLPEYPPEVHNPRPISSQRCIDAMRAMCGDSR